MVSFVCSFNDSSEDVNIARVLGAISNQFFSDGELCGNLLVHRTLEKLRGELPPLRLHALDMEDGTD